MDIFKKIEKVLNEDLINEDLINEDIVNFKNRRKYKEIYNSLFDELGSASDSITMLIQTLDEMNRNDTIPTKTFSDIDPELQKVETFIEEAINGLNKSFPDELIQ